MKPVDPKASAYYLGFFLGILKRKAVAAQRSRKSVRRDFSIFDSPTFTRRNKISLSAWYKANVHEDLQRQLELPL